ncbi:DUF2520 domain-containing protein [Sphingobacterium olei]|uniref:DUF2520 domain-containing protein n=1 Tax=Sphingobacterium olei TaxID=2571155 RepID=A0A4U0P116_9SPHI|nr:Rossmann-like and DUF2520 domain-containing protein [Sphingobacterium olei]TJZ60740.1 DUF2520 domain-containing protein [Sphingobacterium olei]
MDIVILGTGNIATHYAKAFQTQGHRITQVYSKTSANASALAEVVSAESVHDLSQISDSAELYIIAVSDQAIKTVIDQLPHQLKGIVVHTSGATPLTVLNRFEKSGVIYPPQSLSKNVETDLSVIPFAIEGNTSEVEQTLLAIAQQISYKSFLCNSHQRITLHIAAVFVNNFSNALYQVAFDLLRQHHLDVELLRPIILETANKVQHHEPKKVQTGPAIRNDVQTIHSHLKLLNQDESLTQIYQNLTDLIIKTR